MVNPIVLGTGTPIFKDLDTQLKLYLIKTQIFTSGNVLLYYKPTKRALYFGQFTKFNRIKYLINDTNFMS